MTDNFKQECNEYAYKNRLGKVVIGDEIITNSTTLSSIEYNTYCINNDTIIGNVSNNTLKLNIAEDNEYANKELDAYVGVKYDNEEIEYYKLGKFIVSSENVENTSKSSEYNCVDYGSKLDKIYECNISNLESATISNFYIDVCNQCGLTPINTTFTNSNIVVGGNPFKGGESCRQVLSEIAKASCSFVRIEDSSIDLVWFDNTLSETFTKNDYTTLTKNQVYGPVNCLVIQDTYTEGENVTVQDEQSIQENGETIIAINDCYFLYTEELKNQATTAIWNKIKGFTYIDYSLECVKGKPYLKAGNKISIQEEDGTYFQSYILNHTFIYDGSFKSTISASSLTKVEVEAKNVQENTSSKFRRVERKVDKINGVVSDLVSDIQDITYTQETPTTSTTNITNALNKNAISNVVYGNSQQDTRSGINLYNPIITSSGTNISRNKVSSMSVASDGTITMVASGTDMFFSNVASSGATYNEAYYGYIMAVKPNTTYRLHCTNNQFNNTYVSEYNSSKVSTGYTGLATYSKDFTTKSDTAYITIRFGVGNSVSGTTYSTKVMVSEGSGIKPFEQFGAMPSPDFPSDINNVGIENLFNKLGIIENKNVSSGNGTLYTDNNAFTTNFMIVKGLNKITTNGNSYGTQLWGAFYDSSQNFLSKIDTITGTGNKTITVPSNAVYCRLGIVKTYLDTLMVVSGTKINGYVSNYDFIDYNKITTHNATATNISNGFRITKGDSLYSGLNLSTIAENLPLGTFTLSFKLKKVSGTLVNIGGHTIYEDKSFYIDGVLQNTKYDEPIQITDDTKEHYITYTFDTGVARSSALYIQANRGYEDSIVFDVYDIHLTSGDEKNIHYGKWVVEDIQNKNLLPNKNTNDSTTISGITFTKQDNGILVNGTATSNVDYYLYGSATDSGSYLSFSRGSYKIHTKNITGTDMTYIFREKTGGTNFETSSNTQASTLMNTRDTSFYGICIRVNNGKTINNVLVEPMIEIGTTATDYVEYGHNKIQYSLNGYELNKIGNIQDEIDLVSGVLTRRIGKINLVGTESWNFVNQTSYMRSYLSIDNISTTTQDSAISPILCSAFKSGSYNSHLVNTITARYNNAQINIFHNIATSNADFKTWLSNNNVVVYYILNEPETIQLTKQDILLFKDINNISFESNVEPTYKIGYYYGEEKEGTEALQSSLELTSTGIVQQVSRGDIISTINQSAEEVKIDANKISLEGKEINLTSDDIEIKSSRFSVDKEGKITATAGDIAGFEMNSDSFTKQVSGLYNYTPYDTTSCQQAILWRKTPSDVGYGVFDINSDGQLNGTDLLQIYKTNIGQFTNTKQVSGTFKINSDDPKNLMAVYDSDGNIINSIGLGGINTSLINTRGFICCGEYVENQDTPKVVANGSTGDLYASGTISSSNGICQGSLEEIKKDFEPLQSGLDIVNNVDIYKYHYKEENENDKKHIGFVIGDKYKYSEDITSQENNGADIYSMVSVCFKAIQEQQEQIENLKKEIEKLKNDKENI